MRFLPLLLLFLFQVLPADICSDLRSLGVPADSASVQDGMLVVLMDGSLAEGDSLLKHYGGVFYTAVDSILGGWEVCGIAVELPEATLVFSRSRMLEMFDWISSLSDDEAIADWVLNHTRVIRKSAEG